MSFELTFIARNMPIILGYKPQMFIVALLFITSSHGLPFERTGINTTNSFDIKDKEYAIQLPFSIRLFGDGKFSTLYVSTLSLSLYT